LPPTKPVQCASIIAELQAARARGLRAIAAAPNIPNQNLFRVANEKTTFTDAFAMADQVLYSGVACITDLIVKEGLITMSAPSCVKWAAR
jgi:hypothetical protein